MKFTMSYDIQTRPDVVAIEEDAVSIVLAQYWPASDGEPEGITIEPGDSCYDPIPLDAAERWLEATLAMVREKMRGAKP